MYHRYKIIGATSFYLRPLFYYLLLGKDCLRIGGTWSRRSYTGVSQFSYLFDWDLGAEKGHSLIFLLLTLTPAMGTALVVLLATDVV